MAPRRPTCRDGRTPRPGVSPTLAGAFLALILAAATPAGAQQTPATGRQAQSGAGGGAEEAAVLAVVQRLFDAMAARDTALARSVLLDGGALFPIAEQGGDARVGVTPHDAFIDLLATSPGALLERMWDPTVLIHGPMAVVWVPYDFYRDGEFSHCGIDAFNLVRTPDGWKIAATVYTVEREGCPSSPLGPPDVR